MRSREFFLFFLISLATTAWPQNDKAAPPGENAVATTESPNRAQTVVLPRGTRVRVRTTRDLSSDSEQSGSELRFIVASDVKVGDVIIVPKGTEVTGRVVEAHSKRRMGRAGQLLLAASETKALDGTTVPVVANRKEAGRSKQGNIAYNAADTFLSAWDVSRYALPGAYALGAAAPFAIVGTPLFMLQKGEEVFLPQGATLTAYVAQDVTFSVAALRPQPSSPSSLYATVYLYRQLDPDNFRDLNTAEKIRRRRPSKAVNIYCGAHNLGRLFSNQYLAIHLPAGEYDFLAEGSDRSLRIVARAGADSYVQLVSGFLGGKKLVEASATDGDDELALLTPWATVSKIDLTKADPKELHAPVPVREPEAAETPVN